MESAKSTERTNQQLRTRRDLVRAAARILKRGEAPTMESVAEEALVSRATAYRYFPNLDALLAEAPLDELVPDPEVLFANDPSTDPVERLDRAEAALHEMVYENEMQLRVQLASGLSQRVNTKESTPARQNRRLPLIEAALVPVRDQIDDKSYDNLCAVLSLVFGTESMIVFRDVLPMSPDEARSVKSWALQALTEAALNRSRP
jgi:AcrR family transcriptional regulator